METAGCLRAAWVGPETGGEARTDFVPLSCRPRFQPRCNRPWMPLPRMRASMVQLTEKLAINQRPVMDARNRPDGASMGHPWRRTIVSWDPQPTRKSLGAGA